MNKRINFEDTIFILNVRIRMIRDLMHLDVDSPLFYQKTVDDTDFISSVLDFLTEQFLANIEFLDREIEAENLLDAEWQFSQLINEISGSNSSFSGADSPEMKVWFEKLKKDSMRRKIQIEQSSVQSKNLPAEPVVSHAELNGLLGTA